MDVSNHALAIEEETDARPVALASIQPPAPECAPIGIDGDWKFETELPSVLANIFGLQRFIRFVVIYANHFQSAIMVGSIKFVERGRGGFAVWTFRRCPPAHQHYFSAQLLQGKRPGIEPVCKGPFRRPAANQALSGSSNAREQCKESQWRNNHPGEL